MAVTNISARQRVIAAVAQLSIANIGAGNEVTVALPPGAQLTGVVANTTTAFNAATTNTLTVSDGTNTLVNAVDVKTAGIETAALTGVCYYPNGATVTISMEQTGAAATAGAANVVVTYVDVGRQDETYSN